LLVFGDTFYSSFSDANVVEGRKRLSARWRRSRKKRRWFSTVESLSGDREKGTVQSFDVDGWRVKSGPCPSGQRVRRIRWERGMREPEPLLDVLEGKGEIIVVAEFAGFDRDSLRISVDRYRLTLCAQALDRKYYKSLNLPKRVIPNTIRTTCKNGVLEIQLKKAVQEKTLNRVAD
jgi:HSP20 family molecular chaperone IbpA